MTNATTNMQQGATAPIPQKGTAFALDTRQILLLAVGLAAVLVCLGLAWTFNSFSVDDEYFLDTTLGELAVWMSDQSAEEAPESVLGRYAQSRLSDGTDQFDVTILLREMRTGVVLYTGLLSLLALMSLIGMVFKWRWHRIGLLMALSGVNLLVFVFPVSDANAIVPLILMSVLAWGMVLLLSQPYVERVVGFLVVLAVFACVWEGSKFIADSVGYQVTVPVDNWEYQAFDDLGTAFAALESGELDAIVANRNDLRDFMAEYPPEDDENPADFAYPNLRYISDFERTATQLGRPVSPEMPGRLAVAVTIERAEAMNLHSVTQLEALSIGTDAESFADTDYLPLQRELVLVNMSILNDLNLPHMQSISEALLQPARRNGPLLLVRILGDAALYTWTEAFLGFVFGGTLGFVLGTLFTHVALLRRSLLPYVIASQTIPIIAIAPMIVIWLRETNPILPVAIISAYLTFLPVTVNTLRGLQSPEPRSFDLMRSYAASRWQIMWKLRFPAALPYIFTALKISATASVVGAIIGELPSGIRNGLGRAILDFSSDYSLISTPKLWAAILMAAGLGIVFFLIVVVLEWLILRGQAEQV